MDSLMKFRSDQLVKEVEEALDLDAPNLQEKVLELCSYHLEMRNHALRLEATVHRITKGMTT